MITGRCGKRKRSSNSRRLGHSTLGTSKVLSISKIAASSKRINVFRSTLTPTARSSLVEPLDGELIEIAVTVDCHREVGFGQDLQHHRSTHLAPADRQAVDVRPANTNQCGT